MCAVEKTLLTVVKGTTDGAFVAFADNGRLVAGRALDLMLICGEFNDFVDFLNRCRCTRHFGLDLRKSADFLPAEWTEHDRSTTGQCMLGPLVQTLHMHVSSTTEFAICEAGLIRSAIIGEKICVR